MANPFFTIGHSTRPLAVFVDLLKGADVRLVIDVRTVPRSRTNSQYDRDALPASLSSFQVGYEHMPALGGLRGRQQDVSPTTNGYWQNESFHNYADYAMGEDFYAGFRRLREFGRRCAVRHHVCGGLVVAMSSADHLRLSDCRG